MIWHTVRNVISEDITAEKTRNGDGANSNGTGVTTMVSELAIQQTQANVPATVAAGMTLFRHLLEEVRTQGFAGDGIQALQEDGWKRTFAAVIALLRHAHTMIENAEDTIRKQEQRIAHLEGLTTTDELTGIRNRRGFYEIFIRELDRCERGQSEGGLMVLIDLDNFKAINDTHGHAAGDACLRLVARTLASEIRLMDTAARLGGDEFVLLLANTTKQEAAGRAQRLGKQLNNLSLAWHGEIIPIHASLGLRSYARGDSAAAIFSDADTQMYACKRERHRKEAAEANG